LEPTFGQSLYGHINAFSKVTERIPPSCDKQTAGHFINPLTNDEDAGISDNLKA
jgi:hypothetical protein